MRTRLLAAIGRGALAAALALCAGGAQPVAAQTGKPHIHIGVFGPAGTNVTAAISRLQAANGLATAADAKPRATTVLQVPLQLARVDYQTEGRRYTNVVCPSPESCSKSLLVDPTPLDGAILALPFDDVANDRTRYLLRLAKRIGVDRWVIYLDTSDAWGAGDPDLVELTQVNVRYALSEAGLPGERVPLIQGNAAEVSVANTSGEGPKSIRRLLDALDKQIPAPPAERAPGTHRKRFTAEVYVLKGSEAGREILIESGYRPTFDFGAASAPGVVTLPDGYEMTGPGVNSFEVQLSEPVAMERGSRFTMREGGRLVGVGAVGDPLE